MIFSKLSLDKKYFRWYRQICHKKRSDSTVHIKMKLKEYLFLYVEHYKVVLNFVKQYDKFQSRTLGASNFVQENNFPCDICSKDLLKNNNKILRDAKKKLK